MNVKRYDVMSYSLDVDGNSGPFVKYEDYAALEARCAALAAELSSVLTDRAVILEDLDNTCFEIGMQRGEKTEAYPTPVVANHDAFLAEVRAQGVEMLAEHLSGMNISASETSVREFAAQLRKGVQS
ncbi:hypothetical protein [Enterobacter kobei]|uniref:hypothetical protein n=1 Tax=Enterobacter kobei TaxID=208224 RepID=UPI0034640BBD